jgi:hypothetical protein
MTSFQSCFQQRLDLTLAFILSDINQNLELYQEQARQQGPIALVYEANFDLGGKLKTSVQIASPLELEATWTNGSKIYSSKIAEYYPFPLTKPRQAYLLIGVSVEAPNSYTQVKSRLYLLEEDDLIETGLEVETIRTANRL